MYFIFINHYALSLYYSIVNADRLIYSEDDQQFHTKSNKELRVIQKGRISPSGPDRELNPGPPRYWLYPNKKSYY